MKTAAELKKLLYAIDHKGYPAYKDTKGQYDFGEYILRIDHVQGDPFASPSKVSVKVNGSQAGFPQALYAHPYTRIALQDHLTRLFHQKIERYTFKAKGSGKSGLIAVSRCGQEVLERSACTLDAKTGSIVIRMEIGFPANGRSINAKELVKILYEFLPECVQTTLYYKNIDRRNAQQVMELAEDQQEIRRQLKANGLVAFVANGAVLPRESGVSARPMKGGIPFLSPASMEITLELPHYGKITGMGIAAGVTLIVGGGYHGKSTLLKALELGVYNHIAGDGREYVITNDSAVKIRAEDGRSIKKTDLSMFINHLPNGKDTKAFCTEDASGSTSQAANVIESLEAGSKLLLIDEDTSATNFMIRDELMQRVVHRDQEPITPFIERVTELYEKQGVSSIIVAGSSGSYFHIADKIVQMDRYKPKDITQRAKEEAQHFPMLQNMAQPFELKASGRCARPNRDIKGNSRVKMKTLGKDAVSINRETIDLRYVEQITDAEQITMLGYILQYLECNVFDGKKDLQTAVEEVYGRILEKGMEEVVQQSYLPVNLAMPRRTEVYACLNRYRGLLL